MIELREVCKSFDGKELYRNLNLSIQDGEFVCFSGPSGCGKTTLLNIIGGLEPIDSGDILINGKNLRKKKELYRFFRDDVGFIFQNFALVEKKTVRQNLELIAPRSRSDIPFEEALDFVGLKDKIDTKVYKLSGGEQQRVALARLLIKKCNIILADEPTGSLDRENAQAVVSLLTKLNERGKTIILVTHSDEVRAAAKRNVLIDNLTGC